jgi:hypothetical protein
LADLKTVSTKNEFLYFETIPFDNIHVFTRYKDHYENFQRGLRTKEEDPKDRKQYATKNKIVTENDFRQFVEYTNVKNIQLKTEKDKFLPTIKREHLRILSNFIKHKSTKRLGFKKIAKLLKVPQDTVRHWTTLEFQIMQPKKAQEHLINRFELDFLKPKDRGVICEYIRTYIITSDTSWGGADLSSFYSEWRLKEEYGESMFLYLMEFISFLQPRIFHGQEKKKDTSSVEKNSYVGASIEKSAPERGAD